MTFTIYPAVDIRHGQAVQLVQGRPDSAQVFGSPLDAARRWRDEGADWLHLVDLDAALGQGDNAEAVAEIIATTDLKIDLAGGIRDDASAERALSTGCQRLTIGTAAVTDPAWTATMLQRYGDRIAVALDLRGDQLATHGWVQTGGSAVEAVDRLSAAGAVRFVVTDTAADGTLTGLNLPLFRRIASRTPAKIVVSGGVATLDDIAALADLADDGVDGVIIGSALYRGQIQLTDALRLAATVEQKRRARVGETRKDTHERSLEVGDDQAQKSRD